MSRTRTAVAAGAGAILAIGSSAQAITLEEALQILGEQVLRPSTSAADISAYMEPSPRAMGTVEPPYGGLSIDIAAISGNPQWFALVDLEPCAFWEHAAIYVFIDDVTGAVTTFAATDWPEIDGTPLGAGAGAVTNLVRVFPMVARPDPVGPRLRRVRSGDYGDAPDGQLTYGGAVMGLFPTQFVSTTGAPGAMAAITGQEMLGRGVSRERGALDVSDPEGVPNLVDADRDERMFLAWDPNTSPPTSWLIYDVTVAPGAAAGAPRFVNVLIDFDQDGQWRTTAAGTDEWPVKNQPVAAAPGTTATMISSAFAWGDGITLPTLAWSRVALTRTRIDPGAWPLGWDGSGRFRFGEIEDFKIYLRECVDGCPPPLPPPGEPDDGGGGGDDDDDDDDDDGDEERGWDGSPIRTFAIVVQGKDHSGQTFIASTARRMVNYLNGQGATTTHLRGDASTVDGFNAAVDAVAAQVTCQDRVFIYFIAHGSPGTEDRPEGGFMRLGVQDDDDSRGAVLTRADMLPILAKIPPCDQQKCDTPMASCGVTLLLESCFSGQWLKVIPPTPMDPLPDPPINGTGRTIITTSGDDHSSWASRGDGVYTRRFKEAQRNPANDANGDGRVSASEAHAAVAGTPGTPIGGTRRPQIPQHSNEKCDCICNPQDECDSAGTWVGFGLFSFDLAPATANPLDGQLTPECLFAGTTSFDHDIWLCWTSPISGPVIMDMVGLVGPMDTKLAVFETCNWPPSIIDIVICNDDVGPGQLESRVEFQAVAGAQYMLQLGTYPGTPGGAGRMRIDSLPANDDCPNAREIAGEGLFSFNTTYSTDSGVRHPGCTFFGTPDIANDNWYRWAAPSDGEVIVETCGLAGNDTKMAVYADSGLCPPDPTQLLDCNDDACGLQSRLRFPTVAGGSYLIQLGSFPGDDSFPADPGGEGQFSVRYLSPPCEILIPPDVTHQELEPPGDALNNGCGDGDLPQVEPILPGDLVAGALAPLFTDLDVDWYELPPSTNPDAQVAVEVEAQVPVQIEIIQLDLCSAPPIVLGAARADACFTWALLAPLPPGANPKIVVQPFFDPGSDPFLPPPPPWPYVMRVEVLTPDPEGACCLFDLGECVQLGREDCFAEGGEFFGPGVPCADVPCGEPACPCEYDGLDGVNVFDLLSFLDLWFANDPGADIDGVPGVDVFDLLSFLDCWFPASAGGPCP